MPQDWQITDTPQPPKFPAQDTTGWRISDSPNPPVQQYQDGLGAGLSPKAGTTIGPRENAPLTDWLEELKGDIMHGTTTTGPGRALKFLGAGGLEKGVSPTVANVMGGELIGPAKMAHATMSQPTEQYVKEHPNDPNLSPFSDRSLHNFNEFASGLFQSPGPGAALIPGAVPGMAMYGPAGAAIGKGAQLFGANPEQQEAIQNASMMLAPLIHAGVNYTAPKIGQYIKNRAPTFGKAMGYGMAAVNTIRTGNPTNILYASRPATRMGTAAVRGVGNTINTVGSVPQPLFDTSAITPSGEVIPTSSQENASFGRRVLGMRTGTAVPPVIPERPLLPRGAVPLGGPTEPSSAYRPYGPQSSEDTPPRPQPTQGEEPPVDTGEPESQFTSGFPPTQSGGFNAPLVNTEGVVTNQGIVKGGAAADFPITEGGTIRDKEGNIIDQPLGGTKNLVESKGPEQIDESKRNFLKLGAKALAAKALPGGVTGQLIKATTEGPTDISQTTGIHPAVLSMASTVGKNLLHSTGFGSMDDRIWKIMGITPEQVASGNLTIEQINHAQDKLDWLHNKVEESGGAAEEYRDIGTEDDSGDYNIQHPAWALDVLREIISSKNPEELEKVLTTGSFNKWGIITDLKEEYGWLNTGKDPNQIPIKELIKTVDDNRDKINEAQIVHYNLYKEKMYTPETQALIKTPKDIEEKGAQETARQDLERGGELIRTQRGKKSSELGERYFTPPWWKEDEEPPEGASASHNVPPDQQHYFNPYTGKEEPDRGSAGELNDLYAKDVIEGMERTHGELIETPKNEPPARKPQSYYDKQNEQIDEAAQWMLDNGYGRQELPESVESGEDFLNHAKELGWVPRSEENLDEPLPEEPPQQWMDLPPHVRKAVEDAGNWLMENHPDKFTENDLNNLLNSDPQHIVELARDRGWDGGWSKGRESNAYEKGSDEATRLDATNWLLDHGFTAEDLFEIYSSNKEGFLDFARSHGWKPEGEEPQQLIKPPDEGPRPGDRRWEVFDPRDGKTIASYDNEEDAKRHAESSSTLDYGPAFEGPEEGIDSHLTDAIDRLDSAAKWLVDHGYDKDAVDITYDNDPDELLAHAKRLGWNDITEPSKLQPGDEIKQRLQDGLAARKWLESQGVPFSSLAKFEARDLIDMAKGMGWEPGGEQLVKPPEQNKPPMTTAKMNEALKAGQWLMDQFPEEFTRNDLIHLNSDVITNEAKRRGFQTIKDPIDDAWSFLRTIPGETSKLSGSSDQKVLDRARELGWVPSEEMPDTLIKPPRTAEQSREAIRQDLIDTKDIQNRMREQAGKPGQGAPWGGEFDEPRGEASHNIPPDQQHLFGFGKKKSQEGPEQIDESKRNFLKLGAKAAASKVLPEGVTNQLIKVTTGELTPQEMVKLVGGTDTGKLGPYTPVMQAAFRAWKAISGDDDYRDFEEAVENQKGDERETGISNDRASRAAIENLIDNYYDDIYDSGHDEDYIKSVHEGLKQASKDLDFLGLDESYKAPGFISEMERQIRQFETQGEQLVKTEEQPKPETSQDLIKVPGELQKSSVDREDLQHEKGIQDWARQDLIKGGRGEVENRPPWWEENKEASHTVGLDLAEFALNIPNKIAGLQKQFGISKEIATHVMDADPTENKTYAKWIALNAKRNNLRLPEDNEKLTTALNKFEQLKASPNFTGERDIQKYDPAALFRLTREEDSISNKQKVKNLIEKGGPGAQLAAHRPDSNLKLFKVTDPKPAITLSSNTSWCTNLEEGAVAERYLKKGPLWIIYKGDKPIAQMHGITKQFMDVDDRPVDFTNPDIKEAVDMLPSSVVSKKTLQDKVKLADPKISPQEFTSIVGKSKQLIHWALSNIRNIPPEVLDSMYDKSGTDSKVALGYQKGIGEDLKYKLASDLNPRVRSVMAWKVNSNDFDLVQQLSKDSKFNVRVALASNKKVDISWIRHLVNDSTMSVKAAIAKREDLPVEDLIKLSKENNRNVRRAVSYNESTPPDILKRIFEESLDPMIAGSVVYNPSAPESVLRAAYNDRTFHWALLRNPSTPVDILVDMLNNVTPGNRDITASILRNPSIPMEYIDWATRNTNQSYREAAASNESNSAENFELLSKDPETWVRHQLVYNEKVPRNIIERMSTDDPNGTIRAIAIRRLGGGLHPLPPPQELEPNAEAHHNIGPNLAEFRNPFGGENEPDADFSEEELNRMYGQDFPSGPKITKVHEPESIGKHYSSDEEQKMPPVQKIREGWIKEANARGEQPPENSYTDLEFADNIGSIDSDTGEVQRYAAHLGVDPMEIEGHDERVTDEKTITILFDYPIERAPEIEFYNPHGFTKGDLYKAISDGYEKIYDEEGEEEGGPRAIMFNRGPSKNPKYGIWGHDIGDLVIEGVEQVTNGKFVLHMGS